MISFEDLDFAKLKKSGPAAFDLFRLREKLAGLALLDQKLATEVFWWAFCAEKVKFSRRGARRMTRLIADRDGPRMATAWRCHRCNSYHVANKREQPNLRDGMRYVLERRPGFIPPAVPA